MAGVNKVILVGNIGKDPEVRHLENGASVANFSLATSESYKDKTGKRVDQTEWHNIVLWRGLADFAKQYLKKGMTIYIEGKLRTRSWEDKEGHKRSITEVVADTCTMIGPRRDDSGSSQHESQPHTQPQSFGNSDFSAPSPGSEDQPF